MWFDKRHSVEVSPAVFADRSGDRSNRIARVAWMSYDKDPQPPVAQTHEPEAQLVGPDHDAVLASAAQQEAERAAADADAPHEADSLEVLAEAFAAQQQSSLDALDNAVREILAMRTRLGVDLERQLVALAGRIARRVVHREVSVDPAVLLALAREGMNALGASKGVVIRLGRIQDPEMIEVLRQRLAEFAPDVTLSIEDGRPPGYCTVEADVGSVDESIDTRLDNVLRSLIGEPAQEDAPP